MLLSGCFLVVCALTLLSAFWFRFAFSLAALGVELLGIGLLVRSHLPAKEKKPC